MSELYERTSKNRKSIALIFLWGWVAGSALGYLITRVLSLSEPYVIVVLFTSLAPFAPYLQQVLTKARGEMSFAETFLHLVTDGTLVLLPLLAQLLIKWLKIVTRALAKPLHIIILLPLITGVAIRHYSDTVATRKLVYRKY